MSGPFREMIERRLGSEEVSDRISSVMDHFGGLIESESAALLIALESRLIRSPLRDISHLKEGEWASLEGVVISASARPDAEKPVAWMTLNDGYGRIRCVFWRREHVDMISRGIIAPGMRAQIINARIRQGRHGLEAHVDSRGVLRGMKDEIQNIAELRAGTVANIRGIVESVSKVRVFLRSDGTGGRMMSFVIFDGTDAIRVVLWDDAAKSSEWLSVGQEVEIRGGIVRVGREGRLEVHLSRTDRLRGVSK